MQIGKHIATHVYDPLLTDPERWINTVLERYGS